MAMPEICTGIGRQIIVSEAAPNIDCNRSVRYAVVECRSVRVNVEVDGELLESAGTGVPGRPVGRSDRPESGTQENRYVCVPSPIVAEPSPPEICWHVIAPVTQLGLGTRRQAGPGAKFVGPV